MYRELQVGDSTDRAFLLLPTCANKLLATWKGPYDVIGRCENNNYEIQMGNRRAKFHINQLKKYEIQPAVDDWLRNDGFTRWRKCRWLDSTDSGLVGPWRKEGNHAHSGNCDGTAINSATAERHASAVIWVWRRLEWQNGPYAHSTAFNRIDRWKKSVLI